MVKAVRIRLDRKIKRSPVEYVQPWAMRRLPKLAYTIINEIQTNESEAQPSQRCWYGKN